MDNNKGHKMKLQFEMSELTRYVQGEMVVFAENYKPLKIECEAYRMASKGFVVSFKPATGNVDGDGATRVGFARFVAECMYLFH